MHETDLEGFDDFEELLQQYDERTDKKHVLKVLEIGAKELVADVRALPKPRSQVRTPGYTHLLDGVTYEREKNDVAVGWEKYWGPMVENGTVKMKGTAHIKPTYERNKERYYKKMRTALFG